MVGHQYMEMTSAPETKQVTSNVIVNTFQNACMSAILVPHFIMHANSTPTLAGTMLDGHKCIYVA